jgi:hypothetical protein
MELCCLKYALPFNLLLPEKRFFSLQESGQLVVIFTETKHGSTSFSYDEDYSSWTDTNEFVALSVGESDSSPGTVLGKIIIDRPIYDFRGGVIEENEYSILTLLFENSRDDFAANLDRHIKWATPLVKRFVDNCAIATKRGWLGPLRTAVQSRIILAGHAKPPYTFTHNHYTASFDQFSMQILQEHPKFSGRGREPLTEAEVEAFDARITRRETPDLIDLLLIEAEVQMDRHNNFDLAIVHLETAFEVHLQRRLLEFCKKNQVQSLKSGKSVEEAIETGNIQADLFRYVDSLANSTVKLTPEYTNWHNNLYKKRNEIVHRGARGATEAEAFVARDSASAFVKVLQSLLP